MCIIYSHVIYFTESVQLLLTPNSSIDVEFWDTVDYICVGYGEHEPPNILWKFQEIDLMNSTLVGIYEHQITMSGQTFTMSTLELCGVYLEASGVYSCTANNSMNSMSFSFTLNVVVHICISVFNLYNIKYNNNLMLCNTQLTKNTLATTVQFVSTEVQQSVNNLADQSVENLTSIDTILSMVANLVIRPDVIITNNTVSWQYIHHNSYACKDIITYKSICYCCTSFNILTSKLHCKYMTDTTEDLGNNTMQFCT